MANKTEKRETRQNRIIRLLGLFGLLVGLLLGWGHTAVWGQTPSPIALRITAVDDSAFPLVKLNVVTLAAPGGPVSDLTGLSLRENSIPVAYETAVTPVGVDVTFVIDANATMLAVDGGDGETRWQKVQATISRYAQEFMDPAGLDRVSVVVPDATRENGRFLLQNESDPATVAAAMQAADPILLNPTPLNEMMGLAIEQAAAQADDGRSQAVLLLTDAGQIHFQLPFDEIVQQAQAISLPLFVAILGAQADADELFRANRLADPTLASVHHLPQPENGDPIFQLWAQQHEQLQLIYESLQRESGQFPISLNLGDVRATAVLDLFLAAPEISVQPADTQLIRRGDAFDTPLSALQPGEYSLPLLVSWPDNKPRALVSLAWSAGAQSQPPPEELTPGMGEALRLVWDVSALGAGEYEIRVTVADAFGFTASSTPVIMTLVEERPSPPTATPSPTPTPTPLPPAQRVADALNVPAWPWLWLLPLALLPALLWGWRQRRQPQPKEETDETVARERPLEAPPPEATPLVAWLEPWLGEADWGGPALLTAESTTIGRDTAVADLTLADASVARLQARILRQGDAYWLYDEGSAAGTFHNYQRVGLAPEQLQDGDQIGLGRVQLRFRLRPAASLPRLPDQDEEE